MGAKSFVVFNIPPQGCTTVIMTLYESSNFKTDELGCLVEYNNVNKVFNDQLNATIMELQRTYPTTTFLQFDYYAAYLEIFRNTEQYGNRPTLIKYIHVYDDFSMCSDVSQEPFGKSWNLDIFRSVSVASIDVN